MNWAEKVWLDKEVLILRLKEELNMAEAFGFEEMAHGIERAISVIEEEM